MNDKIKELLENAEQSDSIAKNKWRIENREQLREQRKKELKELMEKETTMSNNKQSSVEWLAEIIRFANKELYAQMFDEIEQAKATLLEWLCLLLSIISFFIFAYDIENDRDFYTWLWLFSAMVNYTNYLKFNWNK